MAIKADPGVEVFGSETDEQRKNNGKKQNDNGYRCVFQFFSPLVFADNIRGRIEGVNIFRYLHILYIYIHLVTC